jgi:hypothetical protein
MPEMRRVGNPTCSQTLKIVFSRQRALFLELGLELDEEQKTHFAFKIEKN